MKALFVWAGLVVATAAGAGCNTDNRVEIPAEPAPMPSQGPERAGTPAPDDARPELEQR